MTREEMGRFRRALASYGGFRTNTIALELMQLLFLRTVEIRRGRWEACLAVTQMDGREEDHRRDRR